MTRLHDTIRSLLKERQDCVTRVAEIDQELASVQALTTEAIASVTPVATAPAAAAVRKPATPPASAPRTHHQAQRAAAQGIRFEREIQTAMVRGRQSAKEIAKGAGLKREDVKRALTLLLKAGRVTKIGARGPSVRWELPGATNHTRASRSSADQFETVFPRPGAPKASPREALEGARG
jgi:predicted Rossmann fold nucleotide-binding protein DprA/Smf involved in DNA uptake